MFWMHEYEGLKDWSDIMVPGYTILKKFVLSAPSI